MNHSQRVHPVSGFWILLVVFALVMGSAAPVLAAPALPLPDLAPAATTVTLDGAPTVVSSTTSSATLRIPSGTGTITISSNPNRLMVVGVSWNPATADAPITGVTFTPTSGPVINLKQAISRSNTWLLRWASIWYTTEPTDGQVGYVTVTFKTSPGTNGVIGGIARFYNVDQTNPIGPTNGADNVSNALGVTLNGLVGDELVFDDAFIGGGSTLTASGGNTQLTGWNLAAGQAGGYASTQDANLANSVTMSWTVGGTTPPTGIWVDVAAAINPVCAGSNYHTLTVGHDAHGTVTQSPVETSICAGRTVTLRPIPSSGYLFSGWVGANAGDLVSAGGGAVTIVMNGDKSVTANFAPTETAPCSNTVHLNAAADTYMNAASGATTYNYGAATTIQVDRTTATQRGALLKWNVSSIPWFAAVSSASITLNVTDPVTLYAPSMYDVAKPWVEGTNDGAAGTGASWTNYDPAPVAWTTAGGAKNTTGSIDRATVNLWTASTSNLTPAGSRTVPLTTVANGGVPVVQRWVSGGVNNGVTIQNYTTGTTDPLVFDSREGTTPPVLSVTYCLANNTAPSQPTLVSPTPSGTTGVSTSPTLEVTVNDADGNATDVTFYGRAVGAGSWTNLGTAYAVASGTNATMSWPGLTASTQYEWYVTVNDGFYGIQGPTWTFTTASSPTFTVTYAGNGSTGGTAPTDPSSPYNSGSTVTVLGNTGSLVKTGYTFAGWNTQADGLGTSYNAGDTFVIGAANVTLYAKWTINSYTVTYAGNGSTGGTAPTDPASPYNFGATVTVLGNTGSLVKTGYTFAGWNTQADGLGTSYNAGDTFVIGAANVTLYAKWTINSYTVTYAGNGSTGGTAPTDPASPYNFGATVTVLGNTGSLVKTGYTFAGWNTQADGLGTSYNAGDTFVIGAANVTLYAKWTINSYTVTYAGNGSTGGTAPTDPSSPYNFGATVTVLGNTGSLVKTGYTFAGWNTQADGLGTSYNAGDTFVIGAANVTLYAKWTINSYTVTYAGNGSTGGTAPTDPASPYNFGATVTVLGNTGSLVKTGYTFAGWNTQADGLGTSYNAGDTFVIGSANVTLYAQWTAVCYELTLGHTGSGTDPTGEAINSISCPTGQFAAGELINLSGAVPATGWGIASWYGTANDESTAATNSLTMPAEAHSAGVNYLRLLGDVNLDGSVDSTDALIVLTVDAGLPAASADFCPMNYGDVNADGLANSTDALIILTYDVGYGVGALPVGEPVEEPDLTAQPAGCVVGAPEGLRKWFGMLPR